MQSTSHTRLVILAVLIWYGGTLALLWKTFQLVAEAQSLRPTWLWPALTILVGIVLGVVRGKLLFGKACTRNLVRIAALETPRIWQFFRPFFFALLVGMILLGRILTLLAHDHYAFLLGVAVLDLSIATGLATSGTLYWTYGADR
jgi:hypothetical protein